MPLKVKKIDCEHRISNGWNYDKFPLLLMPKDGCNPLSEAKIIEIQSRVDLRCKLLGDGRIFSLDKLTSEAILDEGYTVDYDFIRNRK